MKINADFSEGIAVHTDQMDWVASPMPGVERKMLDRIGAEVARATSIVRYAPGSHFSEHTHSGGEEFIVLEGTFQDEHGEYPAGTYVRNPIGTHHIPRSDDGCTIFVKLWQFDQSDTKQFDLDLRTVDLQPVPDQPKLERAIIHEACNETVLLERWHPGLRRNFSDVEGAEILIIDGTVEFQDEEYSRHDWIRMAPLSASTAKAGENGAQVWIKIGHLGEIAREGWVPPATH